MSNPSEERTVVSKLGFAVWIRQLSLFLFSITALCTSAAVVILVLQDANDDEVSTCRAQLGGELPIAESQLNTTGWKFLTTFSAQQEPASPEEVQKAVEEITTAIEEVEAAQERRARIDELC